MQCLRFHLALLLLVCLVRTLLPEAWIMAPRPHPHPPATDEPARAPTFRLRGKALISAGYQHCELEQFYHVAYQTGGALPAPRVAPHYAATVLLPPARALAGGLLFARSLRGPPRRA